jgi:hypothetical protein
MMALLNSLLIAAMPYFPSYEAFRAFADPLIMMAKAMGWS